MVDKVKNNDSGALWELHDFYLPIIFSNTSKLHKKYPYIEKEDLMSESIFILKGLCEKYIKNKSNFTYFFNNFT